MSTEIELPRYQGDKQVRALTIYKLEPYEDGSAEIIPEENDYDYIVTLPGWMDSYKGTEEDKGIYVVNEDGSDSWSPTKDFDELYARVYPE